MSRVALITGASRGIGRGIALALAGKGWSLVVNYRGNRSAADETIAALHALNCDALAVQADISAAADRRRLVDETVTHFGAIDLLVNNAGMAPRQRVDILQMSEASYDEVMEVNLRGPFFLTQLVANVMIAQAAGGIGQAETGRTTQPVIVNISSLSAYASSPNRAEYCISKAGMAMMTALFADRLAEHGINVYEIRPGVIATDMTSVVKEKYDKLIGEGLTPIRRWGEADDVARAVLAVAEGYLPFSTGEVINVDGGFHLRRL